MSREPWGNLGRIFLGILSLGEPGEDIWGHIWENIMEIFAELDEPLPVQGTMSVDPMAEAWLRELMNIVVRDYGFTALKTSDIEEIASKKLGGREGTGLAVWLESLFSAGNLVKVHGGDAIGWGPSPRWLAGKV